MGSVFFLLLFILAAYAVNLDEPPLQLIQDAGFVPEQHDIPTRDGYLLSVQRIPSPGRPVVYLQHGEFSKGDSTQLKEKKKKNRFARLVMHVDPQREV